jgi:hypothetical protein
MADLVRDHEVDVVDERWLFIFTKPQHVTINLLMRWIGAVNTRKYGLIFWMVFVRKLPVGFFVFLFSFYIYRVAVIITGEFGSEVLTVEQRPAAILLALQIANEAHHIRRITLVDRRIVI